MSEGKTIELLYLDAGGGHRASALALQAVIREQHRPWQVACHNLMALLDPQQRFRRLTGVEPEHLYNRALSHGLTVGMGMQLKLLQAALALGHGWTVRRLEAHWRRTRPALVVSLLPNFNRAIGEAVARAVPGTPFVTVMTDLADLPPHFWIEPGAVQHLVCGSDRAVTQALALGVDARRIHRTSGMVIHPDFYPPLAVDRDLERVRLGLQPGRPTAVVMFGGQGSRQMLQIEQALPDLQLVLLCGHNRELAERLKARQAPAPRAVLGFSTEICRHLQLGDVFIGKPGPGCLSEALQTGLPVITLHDGRTLPQERFNTEWVLEHGVGRVLRSWRELPTAVAQVFARYPRYRAAVACIDNRAVFELPRILERLLRTSAQPARPGAGPAVLPWREAWRES